MKKTKATFFSDGGHGWLAVKRSLLKDLGILQEVSGCSYQKGNTVYLEEDCDVSLLFNTLKVKYGIERLNDFFEIKNSHTNNRSKIRSYASFNPNKVDNFEVGLSIKVFNKLYLVVQVSPIIVVKNEDGYNFKLTGNSKDNAMIA